MNARKPSAQAAETPVRMAVARDIATKLSASTDALNARLGLAEKDIAALGLGVTAWVDISDGEDFAEGERTYLGFKKDGANWRLFIKHGPDIDGAQQELTALLSAPKAMRIRGAQALSKLLDILIATASKQLEEVEKAVLSVNDVLKGALPGNPNLNDDNNITVNDGDEIPF